MLLHQRTLIRFTERIVTRYSFPKHSACHVNRNNTLTCCFVVLRKRYFTNTSVLRFSSAIRPVKMNQDSQIAKVFDDIIKSENDRRTYKGLELSNGLRVLLISDPTTDKSSASLDVNIGSMSDPKNLPGLAHFLEHMLFLGTEKYPEENIYNKYIKQHGGASNAFTSGTHTNFYFDIAPSHLDGALDIFSQFFICPLFTENVADREVNAVNSEHERNLDDDAWRLSQLEKSLSDPEHDYSKFSTGNIDTLKRIPAENGIDVRAALLDFHKRWYSANIMSLVVLGKESMEDLVDIVVTKFVDIKNNQVTVPVWNDHPYRDEDLRKEINAVPVKDARSLTLRFPIPDLHQYYKSQPEHYVAHLVGHEGPGSLLSELKSRGWVNILSAYGSRAANGFGFFNVNVDLTVEGMARVDDIVFLMFQYLNMIKKAGPQHWIFDEFRQLEAIRFRFKDKESPMSYTRGLASLLHDYPMAEVIAGSYLLEEFRPDLIDELMTRLTPQNLRVMVVGKQFQGKTENKEYWYQTEYNVRNVSDETLLNWKKCDYNANLYLPSKNDFIPIDFDLKTREDKAIFPQIIKNSQSSRIWFLQDHEYLLPKAFYGFEISTPEVNVSPLAATASSLFAHLLSDALNEYVYNAELANLGYNCYNTKYGFKLEAGGFNEKLGVLVSKIVDKLTSFEVDEKRFEILKESQFRALKNYQTQSLGELLRYYTLLLTSNQCWTYEDRIHIEQDLTFDKMKSYVDLVFDRIHIEAYFCGNLSKDDAIEVTGAIEAAFKSRRSSKPLPLAHILRSREHALPDKSSYVYRIINPIHQTQGIQVYFQTGPQDTQSNVKLELMSQLLSEPCFSILRTREQLGYVAFSALRRAFGVQGFRIVIQSEYGPDYLDGRIEAFLVEMEKLIEEMSLEEFESNKKGLITKKLEKPKQLLSYAKKQFEEISTKQYQFNRDEIEAKAMQQLTKDDVLGFFKDHIAASAPKRRKLSVQILTKDKAASVPQNGFASAPEVDEPTEIRDVQMFKDGLGLYPLVLPYVDINQLSSKL
ncbi:Insulin-degrading enzyme [Halotydeus destructor]|nr:Insulin-degrading enzyme [Halotydeus destructor]